MKSFVRILFFLFTLFFSMNIAFSQCPDVFLNEIHYDNISTDVNEFIEVAVLNTASVILADYNVTIYNGSGGVVVISESLSNFVLGMDDGTYTYYTWNPTTIQNGIEGFGLDNLGASCEFLSYEGAFMATTGPASGLMSTDIGVSENSSTPVGSSLQLVGGAWVGPTPDTFGDTNEVLCSMSNVFVFNEICVGSDFLYDVGFTEVGGSGNYEVIDATTLAILGSGTSSPITITIPANTSTSSFDVNVWDQADNTCVATTPATVNPLNCSGCTIDMVSITSESCLGTDFEYEVSFASNNASGIFEVIDVTNGNAVLASGTSSPITITIVGNTSTTPFDINVWDQADNTCIGMIATVNPIDCVNPPSCEGLFINELHYDNASGDVGEVVEVAVPIGSSADLSLYTVTLYNGSNGAVDKSETLNNFVMGMSDANYTYYTWNPTSIQNGAPDGLSLSKPGLVCEFLSYEGNFIATAGPANGLMSTDIGVQENGSDPIGTSLQLIGGAWVGPIAETPGDTNVDNTCAISGVMVSNEFCSGTDFTFDVSFSEMNGSGTYDIIDVTNGNAIIGTGTASPITVTLVGNTSTAPFDIDVQDNLDNTCIGGTALTVTPIDCSSCSISGVSVTSQGCTNLDFIYEVGFTSVGSSGTYELIDVTNSNIVIATSMTSPFIVTISGNTGTTPFDVNVRDQADAMCIGTAVTVSPQDCSSANPCPPNWVLTGVEVVNADYETSGDINSDQTINSSAIVDYDATTEINLNPLFEVEMGAVFEAFIDGCNSGGGGSNATENTIKSR